MTLCIMILRIRTLSIRTLSTITLSIMTLSIVTLSMVILSMVTLRMVTMLSAMAPFSDVIRTFRQCKPSFRDVAATSPKALIRQSNFLSLYSFLLRGLRTFWKQFYKTFPPFSAGALYYKTFYGSNWLPLLRYDNNRAPSATRCRYQSQV